MKKGTATITAKVGKVKLKVKIKVTHTHSYTTPATCTSPAKCSCGKTYGSALTHQMSAATCLKPATCSRCGYKKGKVVSHSYSGTRCIWCNQLNLNAVVEFVPSRTSKQSMYNVRYIALEMTNYGTSELRIDGIGLLYPSKNAKPIELYMTNYENETQEYGICYAGYSGITWFDTLDTGTTFTFKPTGKLVLTIGYGDQDYKVTIDINGNYTFDPIN